MALDYKSSLSRYRRYLQVVQKQPLIRASLWVILSLALTITMIVAALNPTLKTIASLVGQIEQEKKISEELDNKIRAVQQAAQNLEEVRSKIVLLDEAIPMDSKWSELAIRIEKEATDSGLTMTNLTIERVPIKGAFILEKTTSSPEIKGSYPLGANGLPISVTAEGDYLQIRDFLQKMEQMRRVINISSVSIQMDTKGATNLVMSGWAVFTDYGALEL